MVNSTCKKTPRDLTITSALKYAKCNDNTLYGLWAFLPEYFGVKIDRNFDVHLMTIHGFCICSKAETLLENILKLKLKIIGSRSLWDDLNETRWNLYQA